jgi:ferrochelatase
MIAKDFSLRELKVFVIMKPLATAPPAGSRYQIPGLGRSGRYGLEGVNVSVAVVLMAYGSPERIEDVPAYYADIRGGRPVRAEMLEELTDRYRRLGIEDRNPLNELTERTRAALEQELGLPVFTGMKHWTPRIADAVETALAGGARTLVGLVLAPHYSRMSIGGYRAQVEGALAERADLLFVERWHDEPALVELWAERLRGTEAHVVFTAHSLPARILDEGDPYKDELLETSRLVAAAAGVENWSFSFQSESQTGEPWLGPDILDHLDELHAQGTQHVLVAPIGFVADHLEIRWDLDTEARDKAGELGIQLERAVMPNDDPAFVAVLAGIVRRARGL